MLSRNLLCGIRSSHTHERNSGPQTSNQIWKQPRVLGHESRYFIGTAYGPAVSSFKGGENVFWRHGAMISRLQFIL